MTSSGPLDVLAQKLARTHFQLKIFGRQQYFISRLAYLRWPPSTWILLPIFALRSLHSDFRVRNSCEHRIFKDLGFFFLGFYFMAAGTSGWAEVAGTRGPRTQLQLAAVVSIPVAY